MAVKRIWSSHFGHMIPSFLARDSGNFYVIMIVNEFAMDKFRLTTSTSSFRAADSVQIATEHSVLLVTGRTEWLAVCCLHFVLRRLFSLTVVIGDFRLSGHMDWVLRLRGKLLVRYFYRPNECPFCN